MPILPLTAGTLRPAAWCRGSAELPRRQGRRSPAAVDAGSELVFVAALRSGQLRAEASRAGVAVAVPSVRLRGRTHSAHGYRSTCERASP